MATIPTQNAVPSEAPRDLKFNSGKIDEFVTSLEHEYKDRFGRCHMTIEGMRWIFEQLMARFEVDINQAIIAAGYIPMDSFQLGAEITKRNEILRDETTGEYYRWDGDLPKSVPAGSMPESAGGVGMGSWVGVGDASLRSEIGTILKDSINSHYLPTPFYLSNKITSDNSVKVATFNIWTGGSIPEYYGNDYTSKFRLMDIYYELIKSGCDFIGMQECYVFPQNPASDFIIKPFKDSFFGCANYIGREWFYGNLSVSRYQYKEKNNTVYSVAPNNIDKEYRAYTRVVIEKNGIDISIYNTHLSLDWPLAESMRDELIQAIKSDINSHIIVMGDFNRDDVAFFSPFISAGFARANNNQYNTNNRDGSWFIDEILYKGFSSKLAAGIEEIPYKLSDHKLFYLELSL
ncbi:endonuclease/exonuclease/phosphatase family protein [Morganella morganii]|nr:endonuclease/exonuclease/phosphatase family protein [Morganella morganii]